MKIKRTKALRVIRIDPFNRGIAALFVKPDISFVARVLKAGRNQELGREPIRLGEYEMHFIAKMQAPDGDPGFRLLGQVGETVGVALLAQYGPNGGLVDLEIPLDEIKRQITWIDQCFEKSEVPEKAGSDADQDI